MSRVKADTPISAGWRMFYGLIPLPLCLAAGILNAILMPRSQVWWGVLTIMLGYFGGLYRGYSNRLNEEARRNHV